MCRPALALLLLAIAASALGADAAKPAATDLKANESLPWCRVTIDRGQDGTHDYRTMDGWYDAATGGFIGANIDPLAGAFEMTDVVKVVTAPQSPAMPAAQRKSMNDYRARHAQALALKAADDAEQAKRQRDNAAAQQDAAAKRAAAAAR